MISNSEVNSLAQQFSDSYYPEIDKSYKQRGGRLYIPEIFVGTPVLERFYRKQSSFEYGDSEDGLREGGRVPESLQQIDKNKYFALDVPAEAGPGSVKINHLPQRGMLYEKKIPFMDRDQYEYSDKLVRFVLGTVYAVVERYSEWGTDPIIVVSEGISKQALWLAINKGLRLEGGSYGASRSQEHKRRSYTRQLVDDFVRVHATDFSDSEMDTSMAGNAYEGELQRVSSARKKITLPSSYPVIPKKELEEVEQQEAEFEDTVTVEFQNGGLPTAESLEALRSHFNVKR